MARKFGKLGGYTAYKQTVSLFIAPYSFAGKVYAAVGNVPIVVGGSIKL